MINRRQRASVYLLSLWSSLKILNLSSLTCNNYCGVVFILVHISTVLDFYSMFLFSLWQLHHLSPYTFTILWLRFFIVKNLESWEGVMLWTVSGGHYTRHPIATDVLGKLAIFWPTSPFWIAFLASQMRPYIYWPQTKAACLLTSETWTLRY